MNFADYIHAVPSGFWIFAAALLGAIFGSYVNMASYRLPRDISTWKRSRSFCPKCQHQLAWYDNLPILSFLFLRGKCHYCRVPIPPRYLYAELFAASSFAFCAYQYFDLNNGPGGPMPFAWFVLELFLIVDLLLLSIVDFEVWLIPIETTLWWIPPALIAAVIFSDELHPSKTLWTQTAWLNGLIDSFSGAAIGAGFLWAVGFLVALLVFTRNKIRGIDAAPPEAMGMGDVHLLAMFGALAGWKLALMAIMIGVMTGSVGGISKILFGKWQRARRGKDWVPPPQPRFDLPDDGEPFEPMLWPMLVFGVLLLIVAAALNERFNFVKGANTSLDYLIPYGLLIGIGVLLVVAFPFYLYLKKIGRLPGGDIVENDDGIKEEVYQGNYIPFGPSLAFGCLVAVLWDPMLRALAGWFFAGTPGAAPTVFQYHTVGETWIAALMGGVIIKFNAMSRALAKPFTGVD